MNENKKPYEKPKLRKVRLDVKTSVLDVCNTSITTTPADPLCAISYCMTPPPA